MQGLVEGERLLERKQMLGPVVTGECLRDRLGTGVAPGIAQACQHLGVTLAGEGPWPAPLATIDAFLRALMRGKMPDDNKGYVARLFNRASQVAKVSRARGVG